MALVNSLSVLHTISVPALQTCTVGIEKEVRIFSYKCCEGEHEPLGKGDDYAFTFTYGNMGECEGTTTVTDCLSVTDIGGVQLKIMDICLPCYGHDIYVSGCVFIPLIGQYYCLPFLVSLESLKEYDIELVICPGVDLCFYIADGSSFDLTMPPHSISSPAVLFQVEDIFCDACPCTCGYNGLSAIDRDNLKFGTIEDLKALYKENDNMIEEDIESLNRSSQKTKSYTTKKK